jgi:hypothetical protein
MDKPVGWRRRKHCDGDCVGKDVSVRASSRAGPDRPTVPLPSLHSTHHCSLERAPVDSVALHSWSLPSLPHLASIRPAGHDYRNAAWLAQHSRGCAPLPFLPLLRRRSLRRAVRGLRLALLEQVLTPPDYPNGNAAPSTEKACSSALGSACCPDTWECLDNGLCHNPNGNLYGRYSCTDKSWKSPGCASSMCTYGN